MNYGDSAALIVQDGTISSAADMIERSTVELVTVSVGNAHGTSCGTQLWTNDAKLAREAISFIDCVIGVFEDHAALVLDVRADDEIKIEVWHWRPQPNSSCTESNLSLAGSFITTLLVTSDRGRLLRFGTATAPSRAHRRGNCGSLGCSALPIKIVIDSKKRPAGSSVASASSSLETVQTTLTVHSIETLRLRGHHWHWRVKCTVTVPSTADRGLR